VTNGGWNPFKMTYKVFWHFLFYDRSRQNKSRDETYKNATSAYLKTAKIENFLISCIFSVKVYMKHLKCNSCVSIIFKRFLKKFIFKNLVGERKFSARDETYRDETYILTHQF
jgi:hypothetical protein